MNLLDPNSPAFPSSRSHFSQDGKLTSTDWNSGVTIRTLIAKDLMAALVSCPHLELKIDGRTVETNGKQLIETALVLTDSLIAQLNK